MEFQYQAPSWENEGQTPPQELIQNGFTAGYKPPASFFNWFWYTVSKCIGELQGGFQNFETEFTGLSGELAKKLDVSEFTGEAIGELLNDAGWVDGFNAATKEECEAYLQEVLSLQESANQTLALAQQTVQIANEAKQAVTAMENQISQNTSKINTLWDAVFNDITTNPFQIAFTDLSGVTLSAGVWNESLRRLEC